MRASFRDRAALAAGIFLTLVSFLLPLKLGGLAAMSEAASFFPEDIFTYFHITFPPHAAGIFSAAALLLVLSALPVPDLKKRTAIVPLLWSTVWIIAVIPGMYGSNVDADIAFGEFANGAAIAAWSAAAWLLFTIEPVWGKRCAAAFAAGILLTALNGFYQYLYGFEEIRNFVAEQQAKGVELSEAMRHKLADTRIFSFAASSNALAGLLLSSLPLVLFIADRCGKRFEPQKVSRIIFISAAAVIVAGALILTRSRSVIFCLIFAGGAALFSAPRIALKWKLYASGILALLCAGVLIFAVRYGRGTASMAERADYLRTCAVLTSETPWTGSGWGAFFYRHMEIKLSSTDEAARDPHNVVAAFAAQSGIFAAIFILLALTMPLLLLWKERFNAFRGAVFWCGLLFTLHALMDCDIHIPAQMLSISMLYAAALADKNSHPERKFSPVLLPAAILIIISAGANIHWLRGEKALADLTEKIHPSSRESITRYAGYDVEKMAADAAGLRPASAIIAEMTGDWHLRCGNHFMAETNYRAALELNPRRPGIFIRLANVETARGNNHKAEEYLREAARLFPRKYANYSPESR